MSSFSNGPRCDRRRRVRDARQRFADMRVGDVLGDMLRRVGEEGGGGQGLLALQERTGTVTLLSTPGRLSASATAPER